MKDVIAYGASATIALGLLGIVGLTTEMLTTANGRPVEGLVLAMAVGVLAGMIVLAAAMRPHDPAGRRALRKIDRQTAKHARQVLAKR